MSEILFPVKEESIFDGKIRDMAKPLVQRPLEYERVFNADPVKLLQRFIEEDLKGKGAEVVGMRVERNGNMLRAVVQIRSTKGIL